MPASTFRIAPALAIAVRVMLMTTLVVTGFCAVINASAQSGKGSVAASATSGAVPAPAMSTSGIDTTSLGKPFATRYADFDPVRFDSIPGWTSDELGESFAVFRQSCRVLGDKPAWRGVCAQAEHADSTDEVAARNFFEQNFFAYSVHTPSQDPVGLITGYYEPLLDGSHERTPRFQYPVYGEPRDLLLLDARSLSGASRQWLRRDGDRLLAAAPGTAGAVFYAIDVAGEKPDIRDKRLRVRIHGDKVVPYWTRQEIQRRTIDAPVLAWVDDAYKLYSMQIQGAGRIRLPDGSMIRVAFAEQNGQPFMPNATPADAALVASAITTRSLRAGAASIALSVPGAEALGKPVVNPEVAKLIAELQRGQQNASAAPEVSTSAAVGEAQPARAQSPQVRAMIAALLGKSATPESHVTARQHDVTSYAPSTANEPPGLSGISDPSYVFFRVIPNGPHGPPGALGVPLTAGRSLAVDPRSTPLGAPVFVDTPGPRGKGTIERLMLAQDTGGAIRGSVRGDFFWGFGPQAGELAAAMHAVGRMWLLLPRDLDFGAMTTGVRTRGAAAGPLPECVIPDPEECVE